MAAFTAEMSKLLQNAYAAGLAGISEDRETAHLPPECLEAVLRVERHRWFWRPEQPRLILIAESHVYTSDADLCVGIDRDRLAPLLPPGIPLPPCEFVNLVYCLGYGEAELLLNPHTRFSTRSTWQYWDLLGRIAERGQQPRRSAGYSLGDRIEWKARTLECLGKIGVWLLDASVHAIYLGGKLRRSPETCRELHRQWWEEYGSKIIGQCGDPIVWVIGASAHRCLKDLPGFRCRGFVYQPNAQGVDLRFNWDRLMADIASLHGHTN